MFCPPFLFFFLLLSVFHYRICDDQVEQADIFKVEEQHTLQETLKSFVCSCYSIPCQAPVCAAAAASKVHNGSTESDSGLSSS